jgi:uncharacterized protein (DUF849 family)
MQDALALIDSGLAPACLRVLIEVPGDDPDAAVEQAAAIDAELERGGVQVPRLHHGEGPATWAVIGAAIARGRDVRVGLEDVLTLPDGTSAADNAELVAAAVAMISSG